MVFQLLFSNSCKIEVIYREERYFVLGGVQGHYDITEDGQVKFGCEITPYYTFVSKINTLLHK